MIVIGVIGPKGAGKGEIAAHIAKKYQGRAHHHSEILDDVLRILQLPITREFEIRLVSLRNTFGPQVLTNALNKKIAQERAAVEAITGIRFDSELENIRHYEKNAVIFTDAPIEKRFERQAKRGKKKDDSKISFEEFKNLEQRETEINIARLGLSADFKIWNDGSLAELYAKVDEIMVKILAKYAQEA